MMPQARKAQVSLDTTPYYHCISRCVRRAYLFGDDKLTGKNFNHRKAWIVEGLEKLSSVFAIDVCAYAVMSNHYHLVLHVNKANALSWSDETVVSRWQGLFPKARLLNVDNQSSKAIKAVVEKANAITIATWRKRLMDISWFMRCINEKIAREANEEDNCTGRFWEGRFKSQALVDEAAALACMAYVDLNPIRAGITQHIAHSDFTAIQVRIKAYKKPGKPVNVLMPMSENKQKNSLFIATKKYIELVEWTGKHIKHPNKASIPLPIQSVLEDSGINPQQWLTGVSQFGSLFYQAAGKVERLKQYCQDTSRKWIKGLSASADLFAPT